MGYRKNRKSGFTLAEILISAVVLAVMSYMTYLSFTSFSETEIRGSDRIAAQSVINSTYEGIKQDASVDEIVFDTLADVPLANISVAGYPENYFSQMMNVSNEAGSTELKRIDIYMNWTDQKGLPQSAQRTFLLVRPPDVQAGSIKGYVYDEVTTLPIQDAVVAVVAGHPNSINESVLTAADGFYNFVGSNGDFLLIADPDYQLQVTAQGYISYVTPITEKIQVFPDVETVNQDIFLQPATAKIVGNVVNTSIVPNLTLSQQFVTLYQDSAIADQGAGDPYTVKNGAGGFSFEIEFTSEEIAADVTKCFTLVTGKANNLSSMHEYYYPYNNTKTCGHFCDDGASGLEYHPKGWSSSVVPETGLVDANCSNLWFGDTTTDRLCVQAGDIISVPVELVSNPKVTVSGHVTAPADAYSGYVYAYWPSGYQIRTTSVDASWNYSMIISNTTALFSNDVKLRARATIKKEGCCGEIDVAKNIYSDYKYVGPLVLGNNTQNLTVNDCNCTPECGNAHGYIKNMETDTKFLDSSCTFEIGTRAANTTAPNGKWQHECCSCSPDPSKMCIEKGYKKVTIKRPGFYTRSSCPSCGWKYLDTPQINIQHLANVNYDTELWPIKIGSVSGVVIDGGGSFVEGATVTLTEYGTGTVHTATTLADGSYSFNPVIESWPAVGASADDFDVTPMKHTVQATYLDYTSDSDSAVEVLPGQNTVVDLEVVAPVTGA